MNENLKDKIKDNFDIALDGGVTLLGGLLSDALIGQIAPGVVTTYLSYKQKRSEKMILKALDEIKRKVDTIESNLQKLSDDQIDFIKEKVLPFVLDNIIDEEQEEKIIFIINAFGNIIEYKITDEDRIFMYFDILKNLRILDITMLISIEQNETQNDLSETRKMTEEEIKKVDITIASKNHILRKLKHYNLINILETLIDLGGDESIINDDRLHVSVLGKAFLNFFRMI
jgi:hypothetical protein